METLQKQTVRGQVQPETEKAQELKATRASDAEQLAVERHQKINLIWEYTQAYMAILVVTTVLLVQPILQLLLRMTASVRLPYYS